MTSRTPGAGPGGASEGGPDAGGASIPARRWNGLLSIALEALHWIPGLLSSFLYWETAYIRIAPFLWNSQWEDTVQSLDDFAIGLSASSWVVLVALMREDVIRGGSRTIRKWFIAAVILIVPCYVFHVIFFDWPQMPALWRGLLGTLWQLCYVAMVVAACIALSFYLMDLIGVVTTALRVGPLAQGPGAAASRVAPQAVASISVSSATESQVGPAIAGLTSRVGQLEGTVQDVRERLDRKRCFAALALLPLGRHAQCI